MIVSRVRTWYLNYGFVLVGLILLNVGLINWYLLTKRTPELIVDTRKEESQQVEVDDCDVDCVNEVVDAKIKLLPTLVVSDTEVTATPTPTTANKVKASVTPTPVARTEYVSLPGGEGVGTDWASVEDGKWIDTSLYGTLVSASWEGWIQVPGGSGNAYARLYDATNGRAVDGSEIMVSNTLRTSFYSGNLSIWRGQNQYFIQVKSSGGGSVSVDGARIKLVVR